MELPYFQLLVSIHEQLFKQNSYGVRCEIHFQKELDILIKKLMSLEYQSLEELIECLLQTVAVILLYQPFYDVNHRTVLAFMYYFLDAKGYQLPICDSWEYYAGMPNIFPLIYYPNEKISASYIPKYIKLLKKKDDILT